jgi:hypothetical protein
MVSKVLGTRAGIRLLVDKKRQGRLPPFLLWPIFGTAAAFLCTLYRFDPATTNVFSNGIQFDIVDNVQGQSFDSITSAGEFYQLLGDWAYDTTMKVLKRDHGCISGSGKLLKVRLSQNRKCTSEFDWRCPYNPAAGICFGCPSTSKQSKCDELTKPFGSDTFFVNGSIPRCKLQQLFVANRGLTSDGTSTVVLPIDVLLGNQYMASVSSYAQEWQTILDRAILNANSSVQVMCASTPDSLQNSKCTKYFTQAETCKQFNLPEFVAESKRVHFAARIAESLAEFNWIDSATESVSIGAVVIGNACPMSASTECTSAAMIDLNVAFTGSGLVVPSAQVVTILDIKRESDSKAMSKIWMVLNLLYLLSLWLPKSLSIHQHYRAKMLTVYFREQACLSMLDVCLFVLGITLLASYAELEFALGDTRAIFDDYADHFYKNATMTTGQAIQKGSNLDASLKKVIDGYTAALAASQLMILSLTFYFFRYFDLQPRLAVISRTLSHASMDLAHLAVILVIFISGFAAVSFIGYGGSVVAFATYSDSLLAIFFITLGSYADYYDDMARSDDLAYGSHVQSTILIVVLNCLLALLVLNVALAIIIDGFETAKNEMNDALTDEDGDGQIDKAPSFWATSIAQLKAYARKVHRVVQPKAPTAPEQSKLSKNNSWLRSRKLGAREQIELVDAPAISTRNFMASPAYTDRAESASRINSVEHTMGKISWVDMALGLLVLEANAAPDNNSEEGERGDWQTQDAVSAEQLMDALGPERCPELVVAEAVLIKYGGERVKVEATQSTKAVAVTEVLTDAVNKTAPPAPSTSANSRSSSSSSSSSSRSSRSSSSL